MTEPGSNPRGDIQKKLGHSPESFFIGVYDGEIVATVIVGYDGLRGWLYRLAVRTDRQRRGIGRAMVEHAESWLRERGCLKAKLQLDRRQAGAADFYKRLGYEEQDVVSMGKWFRPTDS